MDAENKSGFNIDGTLYEVPDLGTFTMDEIQVLYDYSGLTLEDFVSGENEGPDEEAERESKLRNPGFMRSLMHVAYQRGNPKVPGSHVKRLIGSANVITSLETLAGEQEETDVPLALTSEPSEPSLNGSPANASSTSPTPATSGTGSTTASASEPDGTPPATTASKSDTYSISTQELSAA